MGASFSAVTFSGERAAIIKHWADAVNQSCFESGRSYSGEIGMLGEQIEEWHDLALADARAAEDWLSDHHEKWHPALAVSFMREGKKLWLIGGWCSS